MAREATTGEIPKGGPRSGKGCGQAGQKDGIQDAADTIENLQRTVERLREAIAWVLDDIGYRPPEQLGDKDIIDRWVYHLRAAIDAARSEGKL